MNKKDERGSALSKIAESFLPAILIAGLVLILKIASDNPTLHPGTVIPWEDQLITMVGYVVLIAELAAVLVVVIAVIQALVKYLRGAFSTSLAVQVRKAETIRLSIGHRLSLALEFAMAADVLRLAISPSFSDIILLFAIILLRVLLNNFLENEIVTIREGCTVLELEQLREIENEDLKEE